MLSVKLHCMLTEWMLGTIPCLKKAREFLEKKAPAPEVVEEEAKLVQVDVFNIDDELQKLTTVFWRSMEDINKIVIFNYMLKGMFKEAGWALKRANGTDFFKAKGKVMKAYKKAITNLVFVSPRLIEMVLPEGMVPENVVLLGDEKGKKGPGAKPEIVDPDKVEVVEGALLFKERPLRIADATGERTCLTRSEMLPPGTTFDVEVSIWDNAMLKPMIELIQYGEKKGLGQWRGAGWGSFKVTDIQVVKHDTPFITPLKYKIENAADVVIGEPAPEANEAAA